MPYSCIDQIRAGRYSLHFMTIQAIKQLRFATYTSLLREYTVCIQIKLDIRVEW